MYIGEVDLKSSVSPTASKSSIALGKQLVAKHQARGMIFFLLLAEIVWSFKPPCPNIILASYLGRYKDAV